MTESPQSYALRLSIVALEGAWSGTAALLYAVLVPGLWTCAPGFAAGDTQGHIVVARARHAALAVGQDLRSGVGEGTFRRWNAGDARPVTIRFRGAFDGTKEYLRLEYQAAFRGTDRSPDRLIILSDGHDLFSSEFSQYIRPVGAEGCVRRNKPGAIYNLSGGFPFGIKRIARGIIDSHALEGEDFSTEELPGGHYRVTVESGEHCRRTLEIAPELDWLAVSAESYYDGDLFYRWSAVWDRAGDVRYAKVYGREAHVRGHERYQIEFSRFEPNVRVAEDLFTLVALELPPGARIIDRRPPEGAREFVPRIYRWPGGTVPADKQADRLIEQLESVAQAERLEGAGTRRPRLSPWWAAMVALFGFAGILLVWLARSRAAGRKGSRPSGE